VFVSSLEPPQPLSGKGGYFRKLAFLCFVPCLKINISRSLCHKLYPTTFVNRYWHIAKVNPKCIHCLCSTVMDWTTIYWKCLKSRKRSSDSHFGVLYYVWRLIFADRFVINSTQLYLLIDIAKVNSKRIHLSMQYNNWLNNDLLKMSKIMKNVFGLSKTPKYWISSLIMVNLLSS